MGQLPLPQFLTSLCFLDDSTQEMHWMDDQTQTAKPATATLWIAIVCGLVGRAVRGYRSFPQRDDTAYIPLAWSKLDPELFANDFVLATPPSHGGAWTYLVGLLEATVGLEIGFYLLTFCLSVGTCLTLRRLIQVLGGDGWLLPVAVAIVVSGRVVGLGRGGFGGAFDDAFHFQWVALCCLTMAYAELSTHRSLRAGLWLGLTAAAHPVVGANGAIVFALVESTYGLAGIKRLIKTGLASIVASSPITIPLALELMRSESGPHKWTRKQLTDEGYFFRSPHEFSFNASTAEVLVFFGCLLIGLVAAIGLLRREKTNDRSTLLRVFIANCLVLIFVPIAYGPLKYTSTVFYSLHLTRMTPVACVVGSAFVAAYLESAWQGDRWDKAGFLLCGAGSAAFVLGVVWVPVLIAGAAAKKLAPRMVVALFASASIGLIVWCVQRDELSADLSEAEQEFFEWTQTTSKDSIYIVPPGYRQFRFYSQRSIYVDFQASRIGDPATVPEWRRRLEEIADPQGPVRDERGWHGCALWDASYGERNNPDRIAQLLTQTGCDYFVFDHSFPSYRPHYRQQFPKGSNDDIELLFRNHRFRVFGLVGKVR